MRKAVLVVLLVVDVVVLQPVGPYSFTILLLLYKDPTWMEWMPRRILRIHQAQPQQPIISTTSISCHLQHRDRGIPRQHNDDDDSNDSNMVLSLSFGEKERTCGKKK